MSVSKCSVLVPSYARPSDLDRCLAALECQTRLPDEVIVVVREGDEPTHRVVESRSANLPLSTVEVSVPGHVAALNAGIARVRTELIAILDDDAAPSSGWLDCIARHFNDPAVGGVGGRDRIMIGPPDVVHDRTVVGRVSWFGGLTGNHHVGAGPIRPVEFLKGANMSYRTDIVRRIGFDTRLHGTGAQTHNDLMLSLKVRQSGYTLLYDPAALVDHYAAPRQVGSGRSDVRFGAVRDDVHNETLALLEYLTPLQRAVFVGWAFTIGTSKNPGVAQACRLALRSPWRSAVLLAATTAGRVEGFLTYIKTARPNTKISRLINRKDRS
jgi:GT2 family glycosyltransferase